MNDKISGQCVNLDAVEKTGKELPGAGGTLGEDEEVDVRTSWNDKLGHGTDCYHVTS